MKKLTVNKDDDADSLFLGIKELITIDFVEKCTTPNGASCSRLIY